MAITAAFQIYTYAIFMVIITEQLLLGDKFLDVYTWGARFERDLDTDNSDAFHAFPTFAHKNDSTVP